MRENTLPPQIFNTELRRLRRERAKRRRRQSFLLQRCGEDAAERINDINRQFEQAVIIGLPGFTQSLLENLSPGKQPKSVTTFDDWPDSWPEDMQPDLIICGLVLQSLNNLPSLIKEARHRLVPDGLFISCLLGGESLLGLRRACFAVDQAKYGGIIPRVAPMIDLQQMAGLLGAAGLALPVTDRDPCRVSYRDLKTLISDLRDIGETNSLQSYEPRYEGRRFLAQLAKNYSGINSKGKYEVLFDIIWATGWSPHKDQQKPLKPGSAKVKMSEALKQIRDENS